MDTKKNITDKQLALDKRYIRMAQIWAENSYCQRRKVGALIVKDKMIISDGYNGTPAGFENCCEDENGHISFRFACRGKCHHQSRSQQQQQRRSDSIRDVLALYRMFQVDYTSRYQSCRIFGILPAPRRYRTSAKSRHTSGFH